MSDKQRAFLDELTALFDKYNIGEMFVNDSETISFLSNAQVLSIQKYVWGEFTNICTEIDSYEPKREGAENGNG